MVYKIFIFFIIKSIIIFTITAQSQSLMKARDSTGKYFPDGVGVASPGQSIIIECDFKDHIWWSRKDMLSSEDEKLNTNENIILISNTLQIKNITFSDEKAYFCRHPGGFSRFFLYVYAITNGVNGTVPTSETPFEVNGMTFVQWKIKEKSNVNVSCSCDSGSEKDIEITWKGGLYTNGISENYSSSTKQNGSVKTISLILKNLRNDKDLYGEYICFCSRVSGVSKEKRVYLNVRPVFEEHQSSIRAAEGENVEITCQVLAYPPIIQPIEWRFQNSKLLRDGIRIETNHSRPGFSRLIIPSVTQADRGVYTCNATNSVGENIAGTMVRVKGRFSALWPFIGILVQMVILAVIIIVYEWKKSHKDQEDTLKINSNTKGEIEPAVDIKGGIESTDLRQRLMVN